MKAGGLHRRRTKRRAVFVTDIATPYMVAVFEALAKQCELHVAFCSRTGTRGAAWAFEDGLPFSHRFVEGVTIRRKDESGTDYYLSPRILLEIARHRPHIVITAGFSIPSVYAAAYATVRGCGFVIHSDGTSVSEEGFSRPQMLARRVLLGLRPSCAANSRASGERFAELGVPAARVFHAPHSSRLAPLWKVARTRDARSDRFRVLAVGRLIPRKGFDRLLHAAAVARNEVPQLTVRIAGSGPEEPALKALAAGLGVPTDFLGFVDQPDLPAVYAEADAFAFPTLLDPFGIVLLEAAASGLPLLASPAGGATQDLVIDDQTGFVIEPYDVDGLAAAIVRLGRDVQLRRRLGRAAHELTLGRGPDDTAAAYIAAGEASLRQRRSSLARRLRSRRWASEPQG